MKEWLYRALRTFFQTFISTVAVTIGSVFCGLDLNSNICWKVIAVNVIVPGISAGVAAIMNLDNKQEGDA